MLDAPNVMKMAQEMARHAGARQSQIAKNIAHADVAGYRARDLVAFADVHQQTMTAISPKATRENHIPSLAFEPSFQTTNLDMPASPNGNTVSVEVEMARATDAKSSHDLALSIYKSSLDILRTSLGRGR